LDEISQNNIFTDTSEKTLINQLNETSKRPAQIWQPEVYKRRSKRRSREKERIKKV